MEKENQMLLIDCCYGSGINFDLTESNQGRNTKFRGKFQEAEAINKNKRMYPYDVLNENIERLQESIKKNRLTGELDHPTDSIIHLANASHMVTKLWWEGNVLMGEGIILSTPSGKVLKALVEDGVSWGISSRGVGNGKVNEDGVLVIGESYKLITFDTVADPSTIAAFQEKVASKDESVRQWVDNTKNKSISNNSALKNESTCVDKDVLSALLVGFVKSQSNTYKSRLS